MELGFHSPQTVSSGLRAFKELLKERIDLNLGSISYQSCYHRELLPNLLVSPSVITIG